MLVFCRLSRLIETHGPSLSRSPSLFRRPHETATAGRADFAVKPLRVPAHANRGRKCFDYSARLAFVGWLLIGTAASAQVDRKSLTQREVAAPKSTSSTLTAPVTGSCTVHRAARRSSMSTSGQAGDSLRLRSTRRPSEAQTPPTAPSRSSTMIIMDWWSAPSGRYS